MMKEKVLIGRTWPAWTTKSRVTIGSLDEMKRFQTALLQGDVGKKRSSNLGKKVSVSCQPFPFVEWRHVAMTEREKMLAGELYRTRDPELLGLYRRAKGLLARFAEAEDKEEILRSLFGAVGDGLWIEAPFFCDYGVNIRFGRNCFVNYNCVFVDDNLITIGDDVLIGPAVQLYTTTHPLLPEERITADGYVTRTKPISIGDKVWIGGGAMVMPGVKIGTGSTIGAGSVVTKDIPERCLAAGNPCKVIKEF